MINLIGSQSEWSLGGTGDRKLPRQGDTAKGELLASS